MASSGKNLPPDAPKGDQRKNLRAPIIVQKVLVDVGRKPFFGHAKNISRSGFFVATTNPKEPGETFLVEIPLPHPVNQVFQCRCEVVWKRHFSSKSPYEPGMGLRFIDLPEGLAQAIEDWVRYSAEESEESDES